MAPREPSNADLLREIRGIREIVDRHDKDISALKEWHIAVEAAKQALKEAGYSAKESKEPTNSKAMAAVVGVIALLTAVIIALVKALP